MTEPSEFEKLAAEVVGSNFHDERCQEGFTMHLLGLRHRYAEKLN